MERKRLRVKDSSSAIRAGVVGRSLDEGKLKRRKGRQLGERREQTGEKEEREKVGEEMQGWWSVL